MQAVVVGSEGSVGRLFSALFLRRGMLHSRIDLLNGRNILSPDASMDAELGGADCIVMCVPPAVASVAVPILEGRLQTGALWVDTCSVKVPLVESLAPLANRCEVLSINPMAAPEMGIRDRKIAVVPVRSGPRSKEFLLWLQDEGALAFELSAAEHDRTTAAVQVATHAALLVYGITLARLSYSAVDGKPLWTPPHQVLLGLLGRVASANPDVYWEIQHDHPQADAVRETFMDAMRELMSAAGSDDAGAFEVLIGEIRKMLGPDQQKLAEECARVIQSLPPPTGRPPQ